MKGNKLQMPSLKIIIFEGDDAADMLIYGYIGELWYPYLYNPETETYTDEEVTDVKFLKALRNLEAKFKRINIRINSPGGDMKHGNAIINAIRNSKAEIHTYNDGLAASMAADIWMAAPHRHMASNALLMIHAAWNWTMGTAKDFRRDADILDKWSETCIGVAAEATGKTKEEIKNDYYADYEDHWLTYDEALAAKMINASDDYEVEKNPPSDIKKLSRTDIIKLYIDMNSDSQSEIETVPADSGFPSLSTKINELMKKTDFTKALESGDLSTQDAFEALKAHVDGQKANPEPAKTAATAPPAKIEPTVTAKKEETIEEEEDEDAMAKLEKRVGKLEGNIKTLEEDVKILKGNAEDTNKLAGNMLEASQKILEKVNEIGAQPGASKTEISTTEDPYTPSDPAVAELKKQQDALNAKLGKSNDASFQ
jgi:ATP-dependent protease ClpP protease subunit